MTTHRLRSGAPLLGLALSLAVVAAACGASSSPSAAPAASVPAASAPAASASAPAASAPAAVCDDATAFRAAVTTLTTLKPLDVGVAGVKSAVADVETSAQALLASGKDVLAQPVGNLITSVKALQATLAGLGDQQGLVAALSSVRAAIDSVKTAAADVETTLTTTCPGQ